MFKKEIKLMEKALDFYLLKQWGKKCSECPQNKCFLCTEEKSILYKILDKKETK